MLDGKKDIQASTGFQEKQRTQEDKRSQELPKSSQGAEEQRVSSPSLDDSLGPKSKVDFCKICIVGLLIIFGLEEAVMLL